MSNITTDIFAIAEEEEKNNTEYKNVDRIGVFLGEKSSGKTTLINLLKGTQKEEAPKATYAMEYSFVKRTTNNRKEVVHFYELGGGKDLADLSSVPLTRENFKNIVYIIVVDLSEPSTLMDSLEFWLKIVRESSESFLRENKSNQANNESYVRSLSALEGHDDKGKVKPLAVPTIVVGTKYDQFEEFDPENRKWISRMIRYLSHLNGCSLFFSSIANQKLSAQIRTLLNNYLFSSNMPNVMQKDYAKPIFLPFGSDSFDSMGIPTSGNMSAYDVLRKMSRDYFPIDKSKSQQKETSNLDMSKYPEAKIDSTKLEKDHEMERIRKSNKSESPGSYEPRNSHGEDSGHEITRPSPKTSNYGDVKAPLTGLTSDNVRPTINTVKRMRPVSRGGNTQGQ